MTKNLYEVCAKGERIPEASPNSTCKTWKLICALIWANTAQAAEREFAETYKGEYLEMLPHTREVKEGDKLYKLAQESEGANV